MPRVGFEHTTPVFEWEKTVHALDCAATVIGMINICYNKNQTAINIHNKTGSIWPNEMLESYTDPSRRIKQIQLN
jgi:hypothetical protein